MGRPRKDGVNYWPFDTDLFTDKKIVLIMGEFGSMGALIAIYLINETYKTNGYYRVWDDDDYILASQSIGCGCDAQLVRKVLEKCCERGLFDKELFGRYSILTSRGIQRRYLRMLGAHREKIYLIEEYWLISLEDEDELSEKITEKIVLKSVSGTKTTVFGTKTPDKSEKNATKQSKEK